MLINKTQKLSLNHWRYRLIHWAFGKNIEDEMPENSKYIWIHTGLPEFLYKHYCPLFHLSNFLVLAIPIILFAKFISTISDILYKITDSFYKHRYQNKKEKREQQEKKSYTEEEIRAICLAAYKKDVAESTYTCYRGSHNWFNNHWFSRRFFDEFKIGDDDAEFKDAYELITRIKKEEKERREAKREKLQSAISTISAFSTPVFKFFVYILWAVMFAFLFYYGIILSANLVVWLLSVDIMPFVWLSARITFFFAVFAFSSYCLLKAGAFKNVPVAIEILSKPLLSMFSALGTAFVSLAEFVSMFYTENCPKIELISKEEQDIIDNV